MYCLHHGQKWTNKSEQTLLLIKMVNPGQVAKDKITNTVEIISIIKVNLISLINGINTYMSY